MADRPDWEPAGSSGPGRLPLPPELDPRRPSGQRGARRAERKARRSRRTSAQRWGRGLSWTALTLSLVILVLSAAGWAYYEKENGNITRINNVFTHSHTAKATTDGAENILVVGDDSRVGETAAELAQENTAQDGGSNDTDTIIIAHLAPDNGPATMISIPRDSYVPIPGFGTFKINSAFADGQSLTPPDGPGLLVETIENLTGLHIDHFIEVDFPQFISISNAIGGVQVCVSTPGGDHDKYSGVDLPEGVSTISGAEALAYVRQRHGLPEGDLDRIKHQQQFISAAVKKIKTIRNPLTLNALLSTVTHSLTVDSGLTGSALLSLADRLKNLGGSDIRFATVPVLNENASTRLANGQDVSYVELNLPKLTQFFANIKAERDPNYVPPTPTATAVSVAPNSVSLTVENGSGVNGAAGRTQTSLESYGFTVTSIGTVAETSTQILYNPNVAGAASAAAEVAKAVTGATTVETTTLTTAAVELIVGTNFTGVHFTTAVVTSPSSTPSASPSASATPSASASSSTAAGTTTAAQSTCTP